MKNKKDWKKYTVQIVIFTMLFGMIIWMTWWAMNKNIKKIAPDAGRHDLPVIAQGR